MTNNNIRNKNNNNNVLVHAMKACGVWRYSSCHS